jgi:class 3 adenylate cyclase
LAEADLGRLGVASLGHRKKLLRGIAALSDGSAAPTPVARPRSGRHGEEPGPAETGQAERRQLTVMFVDLVGSTALSSKLDPEEMGEVLRSYQNAVVGEITRFGGYAAKYMGDGVLCYFGWPEAHEDDAERAIRAGLDLIKAIGRLGAPGGGPLAARVGIATGLVVVGELIGAAEARERAVIGETPNLAARLQQLAEPGTVVLSEPTRRLIGGLFELEELPPLALKGLDGPQRAYRVLSRAGRGPSRGPFRGAARDGSPPAGRPRARAGRCSSSAGSGPGTARAKSSYSPASRASASRASCAPCASGSSTSRTCRSASTARLSARRARFTR